MTAKLHRNYFLIFLVLVPLATHSKDNTVVATINVGVTPAGLAITCDDCMAYVANNNNYGIADEDTVSVLDLKHKMLKQTISDPSFDQPYTVTLNRAGTRAYVTNSNSTTITIINTANNTVMGTIDGFDGPSGMVIAPNCRRAYVNNYGAGSQSGLTNTVRVVDLNTNTIIGQPIVVGQAPAALAMSPNGQFVYVINYVDGNPGTGTMSIIQTSNNGVIDTIPGFSGPFGIAITPNGKYAFVTNFGSNNFAPFGTTVSVVNLQTHEIVDTIEVGIQPSGIAISPDGRYAYVTNYNTLYAGQNFTSLTAGQGTVNIIDVKKRKVIAPTILVGQSPDAIAIAHNGKYAYVTNYTSNTVSVIKLDE
jgi:YVTN family beta-propeller protein